MPRYIILIWVFIGFLFADDSFLASELKFKDIFAQRQGDTKIYCPLGNGFFLAPRSGEENKIISEWMSAHPNAIATPVSIIGEGSKFVIVYVWITENDDSLNLALVQKGAFDFTTMLDAIHFKEITKNKENVHIKAGVEYAEKNLNIPKLKETPPRRLISDSKYGIFLKKLEDAHNAAYAKKNGIWSMQK